MKPILFIVHWTEMSTESVKKHNEYVCEMSVAIYADILIAI